MTIQSISSGPRQSNFEVLRIIAMFLVLMVHANFMSISAPSAQEIIDNFIPSVARITFENLSLLGVNIFIMISGWFTIKPSIKGLSGLLFQVFYFGIAILVALTILGRDQFTLGRVYQIIILNKSGWFVISYVILYLLSPALNKFSTYASKQEFKNFLISYFTLLILFGYFEYAPEIGNGFSALSFVGMYLLAQYTHKYVHFTHGGLVFVISLVLNTALATAKLRFDLPLIIKSYDNPFIIIGAWGLIMQFSQIKIKTSKIINYIARSTFAVYLFHIYPNVLEWFCGICKTIYDNNAGIICLLYMTGFMLSVYIFSIIIDAPRRLIWHLAMKFFNKQLK